MYTQNKLTLIVHKALLTKDVCTFSTMDPYFIAKLGNKQFKSQIKKNAGKYPIWEQTVNFDLAGETTCTIDVLHENDLIGTGSINLTQYAGTKKANAEIPIVAFGESRGKMIVSIECGVSQSTNQTSNTGMNFDVTSTTTNIKYTPSTNAYPEYIVGNISNPMTVDPWGNQNTQNTQYDFNQNFQTQTTTMNNQNVNFSNQNFSNQTYQQPDILSQNFTNQQNFSFIPQQNVSNPYSSIDLTGITGVYQPSQFESAYTCGYSNIPTSNVIPQSNVITSPPVWRAAAESAKQPIFFQNNSTSIYAWDFTSGTWKQVSNLYNQFFPKFMRATELPDGSFLLTGGEWEGTTVKMACHFVSMSFVSKADMIVPRKAHSTVYVKGFVYVFGGFDEYNATGKAERFDVNTGSWKALPEMNYARAYSTLVKHGDDSIYIVGGFNPQKIDGYLELIRIEKYDIRNNYYEVINYSLPMPVYGCLSLFSSNTKLLIAGGWSEEYANSSKVYTIDISNGAITYLSDLPVAGWTVMPPFYSNGSLHMFQIGEEEAGAFPDHILYSITI